VDVAARVTSVALSEEISSRKKARLGWGEGLAKYEKKKVEGPDASENKDGAAVSASNMESIHFQTSNLADKSPRVMGFSDCASPATPSSVACSSSPGTCSFLCNFSVKLLYLVISSKLSI
jgi:nuclear receptor co-repressor 1